MKSTIDLTGQKFGRWVVLHRSNISKDNKATWSCECKCGTIRDVQQRYLLKGLSKSCGCLKAEVQSKPNRYEFISDGVRLWTNNGDEYYISTVDFDRVHKWSWRKRNDGYFHAKVNGKDISLHKFILGYDGPLNIDHRDNNRANNRRDNLRQASIAQNAWNSKIANNNTSGVTGVHFSKTQQRWVARIMVNGRRIGLGSYIDKQDAINARYDAEQRYYGEWSYRNSQSTTVK